MTEFWPSFWQSFWPNLASTVVGLALGLPLALWTNRLITTYSQRQQRHDDRERLNQTLETLKHAMTLNLSRLEILLQQLQNKRAAFETALDYSAWEAVRAELTQSLRDPALQQQVAYYFSRIRSLTELSRMYLDYLAGISAAVGGSERTRDALQSYLLQIVPQLHMETQQLIENINTIQRATPARRVWLPAVLRRKRP
jgi:hypothetical protein